MINIQFDIQDTIDEFRLDVSQVDNMCDAISQALTLEIHRNWIEEAKRELNSTRNGYMRGLIIKPETNGTNSIVLVGQLNNMIESGSEPFDMKNGFKKSLKVKYDKKGNWYLTIPFRFATPGALGESEVFSGVMPQEIYDIIKGKTPEITDGDGNKVQSGVPLSASEIPEQYQTPKTRESVIIPSINKVFEAYTHKTSVYEGLMKSQKTYEETTQSTYGTFRRVGANSDPNSWIHKGFQAKNLAEKAIDNTDIDTLTNNAVDKILAEYGF